MPGRTMIRLQRNYEILPDGKTVHGVEAIDVWLFGLRTEFRWRSAQDGRTPHYSLSMSYGYRSLFSWTIYTQDQ